MQLQNDNNNTPQDETLDGEFIAEMDLMPVEEPLGWVAGKRFWQAVRVFLRRDLLPIH